MSIVENLQQIKSTIPSGTKLLAVSKTKPNEAILEAYNAGQRLFGENKVQEMVNKYESLPKDIEWHLIGHLQTNKVKFIAPFVSLIHSVDSLRLLAEINKEGMKNNRVIKCLLQFHIATEETKFGLSEEEAKEILCSIEYNSMKYIQICGVMGMATFTDDETIIRNEFNRLKSLFNKLKQNYFYDKTYFSEISMGMSDDYLIAIEQGSTIVRIGSTIFGTRNYN
jgi:PLP dependent protein